MEIASKEIGAVKEVALIGERDALSDLAEVQLAMVGGGSTDVIFG